MVTKVDNAWVKLVKEAEDSMGKVVTEENIDSVNAAMVKQAPLLVKLKQRMRHELRMQRWQARVCWAGSWLTGKNKNKKNLWQHVGRSQL